MGEHKLPKRAKNKSIKIPPGMVTDFFKGVAIQLEQLEFMGLPDIGGRCMFHTLAAYQAIRSVGVDVSIGIGGVLARVGPDEWRDVVAFCGPHNVGMVFPDGNALFHCWVRYDDWIFDASVGEWGRLNPVKAELYALGGAMLGPIQWSVNLPKYWLKPRAEVESAWRPQGTPELGKVWYCPFQGKPEVIEQRIRLAHEEMGETMANALARIFNRYCEQKGSPQHCIDERVYPLKFQSISVSLKSVAEPAQCTTK